MPIPCISLALFSTQTHLFFVKNTCFSIINDVFLLKNQFSPKNITKDQIASEIRLPLRADCSALSTVVKCDYRKSDEREKAIDKLNEYRELFNSIFSKDSLNGDLTLVSLACNTKLVYAYIDLVHVFDEYVQLCDIDINEAITKRCDDYDRLSSEYSVDNKPVF